MRGYFGLTDPEWNAYLSSHPHVDEVNFWQPHGDRTFRAIQKGEMFFFKLRAPHKAIAGFGLRVTRRPKNAAGWGSKEA